MGKDLNRPSQQFIVTVIRDHIEVGHFVSTDLALSYAEMLQKTPNREITSTEVQQAAKSALKPVTLTGDSLKHETTALNAAARDRRLKGWL